MTKKHRPGAPKPATTKERKQVNDLLERNVIAQKELAQRMGVRPSWVSAILHGRHGRGHGQFVVPSSATVQRAYTAALELAAEKTAEAK